MKTIGLAVTALLLSALCYSAEPEGDPALMSAVKSSQGLNEAMKDTMDPGHPCSDGESALATEQDELASLSKDGCKISYLKKLPTDFTDIRALLVARCEKTKGGDDTGEVLIDATMPYTFPSGRSYQWVCRFTSICNENKNTNAWSIGVLASDWPKSSDGTPIKKIIKK